MGIGGRGVEKRSNETYIPPEGTQEMCPKTVGRGMSLEWMVGRTSLHISKFGGGFLLCRCTTLLKLISIWKYIFLKASGRQLINTIDQPYNSTPKYPSKIMWEKLPGVTGSFYKGSLKIIFALLQNQQPKQLNKKCGLRFKRKSGKKQYWWRQHWQEGWDLCTSLWIKILHHC